MSTQDSRAATLGLAPTLPSAAAAAVRGPIPLDDVPLNAFHVKIAGLTFGAHFTEGFALGTIGYALASLNRQMPLDAFWMGMIGSSALMGIFVGSLVFGWLSDRLGRQKIFLLSFLIITAAAFAQFYVSSPFELCLLRVLIGFGMGGDFAVGHAILAEFSPRKHRGTLLGSFSVVWTIGYVMANVLGMQYADASPDAWRWLLASAGIPALIVLILRMGTPESPRWLHGKGRVAEAKAIVLKHFGPNVTLNDGNDEHVHMPGGFMRGAPYVSDRLVRSDMYVADRVELAAGVRNACDDRRVRDLHADDVCVLESCRRVSAGVFSDRGACVRCRAGDCVQSPWFGGRHVSVAARYPSPGFSLDDDGAGCCPADRHGGVDCMGA